MASSDINRVSDRISVESNTWNMELLHSTFSKEIVHKISSIVLSSEEEDTPTWTCTSFGKFSANSCYYLLSQYIPVSSSYSQFPWNCFLVFYQFITKNPYLHMEGFE